MRITTSNVLVSRTYLCPACSICQASVYIMTDYQSINQATKQPTKRIPPNYILARSHSSPININHWFLQIMSRRLLIHGLLDYDIVQINVFPWACRYTLYLIEQSVYVSANFNEKSSLPLKTLSIFRACFVFDWPGICQIITWLCGFWRERRSIFPWQRA